MQPIPARLKNVAVCGHVAGADQIIDDEQNKNQETINSELITAVGTGGTVDSRIAAAVNAAKSEIKGNATSACDTLGEAEALISAEVTRAQTAEADRYTKSETYTKTEVNGLVDTPHQEYVTVDAYANLPATGSKDTVYRVSNYNGSTSQVDASVYSEYAWNGSQYVFLCVKSQIGEVFDISVYNNNAKYADLAAALNGGANIPQSLRKGGMSVKFVQSSDNMYVQYTYIHSTVDVATFTNVVNWQCITDGIKLAELNLNPETNLAYIDISDSHYAISSIDGSLIDVSPNQAIVKKYRIESRYTYQASGRIGKAADTCMVAYYNASEEFIGYEIGSTGVAKDIVDYQLTIPNNAAFVKIKGQYQHDTNLKVIGTLNLLQEKVDEIEQNIEELNQESGELKTDVSELQEMLTIRSEVTPNDSVNSRIISSTDGSLLEVSTSSSVVKSFNIDPTKSYKASGRIGRTSGSCMIAYYNSDTFLGYEIASDGTARDVVDYSLTVPNNATTVKIEGNTTYQNAVLEYYEVASHLPQDVKDLQQDTGIPQIIDNPIFRRTSSDSIKILCFGSSWFMNTWWYLNKITQSVGINAELHCYYMGHSQFVDWVELYKNDLTPLSGSEASRDASKNISVNGADWTKTNYGSNYTAQQFRDDFYNDLISEDWDIIAFQQGARQAPYWDLYWKDSWSELVEIIKTHCNPNTIIAFNSTWTPAVQDSIDLSPWPATREGQMEWQKANWDNTKKFMKLSGIYNVSPNGKTMYLLRDSELNTETDLADDGLHPNNGLPMYALSGTWFETYLAPMFGISFKSVEWLPTTSTQKASVSHSTWTPISAEDSVLIKSIIKKALGCRFNF